MYVTDKNFTNPRTYPGAFTVEQALTSTLKVIAAFNYVKGVHGSPVRRSQRPVFGSPWSAGLGAGGKNGIGQLTTLESSAKSLFRGLTIGLQKQFSNRFQFQMNYQLSEDLADDDNERDPFTYRYAVANNFKPDYGFSDRNRAASLQRVRPMERSVGHRVFAAHQLPHAAADFAASTACWATATLSSATPCGKTTRLFTLDFRVDKNFKLNDRFTLQGIVDVYNLTNRSNPKHPETTSLLFNFDGTVQSGLGDPRQAQLGLRLLF